MDHAQLCFCAEKCKSINRKLKPKPLTRRKFSSIVRRARRVSSCSSSSVSRRRFVACSSPSATYEQSAITMTNISRSFTYKMPAKINWHGNGYGTKSRHTVTLCTDAQQSLDSLKYGLCWMSSSTPTPLVAWPPQPPQPALPPLINDHHLRINPATHHSLPITARVLHPHQPPFAN